jgi:hypothetical protein
LHDQVTSVYIIVSSSGGLPLLRFTEDQIEQMLFEDEGELVDCIVKHLRNEAPELIERMPDEMVADLVESGLRRARSHGIRRPFVQLLFVVSMFEIAPNFDQQPNIQRVLKDPSIPPDERLHHAIHNLSPRAWEEAERNYDSDEWFPELKQAEPEEGT